jgi:tetratricopeptide (TPR) repeat protein
MAESIIAAVSFTTGLLLALLQSELEQAERLRQEGKPQQAIAVLEELLQDEPEHVEGGKLLAWLYTQGGDSGKAIDLYRRLSQRRPGDADLHNSLGALLVRSHELEEARRELETALSLDPRLPMAHFNLGLLNLERGAFQASAESFARAVELDPSNARYHFSLARAYRASYRFEPAAAAFRSGLALEPEGPGARGARLELGLALKHQGLLNEAETELRELLRRDANDPDALFQVGRLYVAMNRYRDAEEELRRLVAASPEHSPARFMLGFVLYRQDRLEEALPAFRELLQRSPDHVEGLYYLGMILQKQGDFRQARESFEEALRLDPEHAAANYNLALLLGREGALEESRERLAVFRGLSERRERLESLEERVRWDPENARFFFELGQEYSRQKRNAEALQAFQRALDIEPDLAAAEVAIANLLGDRKP